LNRTQITAGRDAHHRPKGVAADELRRHNLAAVVESLHLHGPVSRSELTATTGLNRSTIADLIGELTNLGLVEEARSNLEAVLDVLPSLPMPETHVPRLLDTATRVLLESGKVGNSALLLGLAEATEMPGELAFGRVATHEELRKEIATEIGEERTDQLIAEGARLGLDDAWDLIRRSLA